MINMKIIVFLVNHTLIKMILQAMMNNLMNIRTMIIIKNMIMKR